MNGRNVWRNAEEYFDPTAGAAIRNYEEEHRRFRKLLRAIFYICELSGFRIEGRIVLVDKRTGKVWR